MKIEQLQEKISEKELDAYLTSQNARYLSETSASTAAILTEKESILICKRLDLDRAEEESKIKDIRAYSNYETPLREDEKVFFGKFSKLVSEILEDLEVKKLGFDYLEDNTLKELKKNYEAEYQKESEIISELRKTKTKEEIKRIRKASEIAAKGMKKAAHIIEPGKTELEVAAEVEYEMRKRGSEGIAFDTIVASGNTSWFPHTPAKNKKIRKDGLVTIDLGARWKGYKSDMTRTFVLSDKSKLENMTELVKKAKEAALEKIKPGVEAKKVDEEARKVLRKQDYEKYLLHGIGHGVGLNTHEPPTISPSSKDTLEKNMVITVEPGVYIKGTGGCRFEDTLLVTDDGYEIMTSL